MNPFCLISGLIGFLRDIGTIKVDGVRHNNTKLLLEYWLELFKDCNLGEDRNIPIWPDRSQIQPAQCRSLLGNMFILETSGGDIRYRLAGTKLCSLYGRELKQEKFSENFDPNDQQAAENWVSGLSLEQHVVLICSVVKTARQESMNLETLLLPLSNAGGIGRRILGITVPHNLGLYEDITGPISMQSIRSARSFQPWEELRSQSNDAPVVDPVSVYGNRRREVESPLLSTEGANLLNFANTPKEFSRPPRKVRHLMIIDGGLT